MLIQKGDLVYVNSIWYYVNKVKENRIFTWHNMEINQKGIKKVEKNNGYVYNFVLKDNK